MQLLFPSAEEPDEITHEAGRKMFAGETDFVKGVVAMEGLPDPDRPEVCFAGRSNVCPFYTSDAADHPLRFAPVRPTILTTKQYI